MEVCGIQNVARHFNSPYPRLVCLVWFWSVVNILWRKSCSSVCAYWLIYCKSKITHRIYLSHKTSVEITEFGSLGGLHNLQTNWNYVSFISPLSVYFLLLLNRCQSRSLYHRFSYCLLITVDFLIISLKNVISLW